MTKKISLDSYEKMAKDYSSFVDGKPWNADYERPAMLELIGEIKGKKILDAGCAAGWYSKTFLELKATRVVGMDFSSEMIRYANLRLKDLDKSKYKFYHHDLNEKCSFLEDRKFDLVVSSLTMHYIEDWKRPLTEFYRVLKSDGRLVISIHHPLADYIDFQKENYFKKELQKDIWNMDNKQVEVEFYTRSLGEIIKEIVGSGFLIEDIIEPKPTKNFEEKNKKAYDYLMKNPNFLLIKALKKKDC